MNKGHQESSCNWQGDGVWLVGFAEPKARRLNLPNPSMSAIAIS